MSKRTRDALEGLLKIKKLKKQYSDAVKMACRYMGVQRDLGFDSLQMPIDCLVLKRGEFIDEFCTSGVACKNLTIVTLERYELDHIKPLKLMTCEEDVVLFNQLDNIQFICPECNRKKSTTYTPATK